MNKSVLKKILGVVTVIMLTFVIPVVVTTVTSEVTLDNRSSASVNTNTNSPIKKAETNTLNKIYPVIVGVIVFIWLVTILVYLGYRKKGK